MATKTTISGKECNSMPNNTKKEEIEKIVKQVLYNPQVSFPPISYKITDMDTRDDSYTSEYIDKKCFESYLTRLESRLVERLSILIDTKKEERTCDGCKLYGRMGVHSFTCPIRGEKIEVSSPKGKNKEEERCQECLIYFNRRGGVPENVTLRPQIECVLHRDILSPQSPLSEEYLIKDLLGCMRGTTEEYRLTILKDFIRTTRLEEQRSLAEEIYQMIQLSVSGEMRGNLEDLLVSKGLLPKITAE